MIYCIVTIFSTKINSIRYDSLNKFINTFDYPNTQLKIIELAYGSQPFMTNADFKIRTSKPLWHKENLINIAISKLPKDWKYVAWLDADIYFENKNWASEAIESIDNEYVFCQPFTHCINYNQNKIMYIVQSFSNKVVTNSNDIYHTGYVWITNRKTYDYLGKLFDLNIYGSGDFDIAHALIGKINDFYPEFVKNQLYLYNGIKVITLSGIVKHFEEDQEQHKRYKEMSLYMKFLKENHIQYIDNIIQPTNDFPLMIYQNILDYYSIRI